MEYSHKSVLLAEVTRQLKCTRGYTIIDCTLGGAGHSEKILELIAPDGFLLGIDQDEAAINAAKVRLARFSQHFELYKGNFAEIDAILALSGILEVDGFLLDLGLSSLQLGDSSRGFSYQRDESLDMRFNQRTGLTAADIVNNYPEDELAKVLKDYGEERWAERIASFIIKERSRGSVKTTGQLVDLIKAAIPASARRRGPHPAKRTFQALRIEVNKELESLKQALEDMPKWLKPGGRIVIISYHSLEDRLVKTKFKELATGCVCPPEIAVCICGKKPSLKIVTAKPVFPSPAEIEDNPRARSARLRTAERMSDADS